MPPEPIYQTVPIDVERPPGVVIPKPAPISLVDVQWVIVQTEDGAVFALTPDEYENLSTNTAEILRYVREADAQIEHYRGELTHGQ